MCFHTQPTIYYIPRIALTGVTRMYRTRTTPEFPTDENYLTSPINVILLLTTLLGSGATKGKTASDITNPLLLRPERGDRFLQSAQTEATGLFNELYSEYTDETIVLNGTSSGLIKISNGVFIEDTADIHANFKKNTEKNFFTRVEQLNFQENADAMNDINKWVNEETNGRIPRCFQSLNELAPNSSVVLLNVLSFKASWLNRFSSTNSEEFGSQNGTRTNVSMMTVVEKMPYMRDETMGILAVRKSFSNTRFSFLLVVSIDTEKTKGMEYVLNGMYPMNFVTKKQNERVVSLKLPKFSLNTAFDLMDGLKKFYVEDLFRKDKADLSGISSSTRLYVNLWREVNALTLNEAGVDITSTTGTDTVPVSSYRPEVEVVVNSTFVFIIYDEELHLPVLAGRVTKPEL